MERGQRGIDHPLIPILNPPTPTPHTQTQTTPTHPEGEELREISLFCEINADQKIAI
jgi:hypothetical protein